MISLNDLPSYKVDLSDCTFLIPVRIDSIERFENLSKVTDFILEHMDTNIIVLEASKNNTFLLKKALDKAIEIITIEDHDPIFHRTKYINKLVKMANTDYLAIWDADVIVALSQICATIDMLREDKADFVFPFDGRFMDVNVDNRQMYFKNDDFGELEKKGDTMSFPYGYNAVGGAYFVNRKKYIQSGIENERFYGWGLEDGERVRRWDILDMRAQRVGGRMFHLTHPRGINSTFVNVAQRMASQKEHMRIIKLSKEELIDDISKWPHMQEF